MLGLYLLILDIAKPKEATMRVLRFLVSGLICGAMLAPLTSVSFAEEDSLYVPLYTYRTGPVSYTHLTLPTKA